MVFDVELVIVVISLFNKFYFSQNIIIYSVYFIVMILINKIKFYKKKY